MLETRIGGVTGGDSASAGSVIIHLAMSDNDLKGNIFRINLHICIYYSNEHNFGSIFCRTNLHDLTIQTA